MSHTIIGEFVGPVGWKEQAHEIPVTSPLPVWRRSFSLPSPQTALETRPATFHNGLSRMKDCALFPPIQWPNPSFLCPRSEAGTSSIHPCLWPEDMGKKRLHCKAHGRQMGQLLLAMTWNLRPTHKTIKHLWFTFIECSQALRERVKNN